MTEDKLENLSKNTKYKDGVNKNARLVVRNVSFKATEEDLRGHFSQFGVLEEVKLLKRPDGKLVGIGFVHFKQVPMANKALAATNKKPFLGRPIFVDWAIPKHKYEPSNSEVKQNSKPLTNTDEEVVIVKNEQGADKDKKKLRINRNARLIIRNISFKATEESLEEHFARYGELLEVNLLRKPDGKKLVGCAFVLYKNVPMAKKALLSTNMKPFLGRPISVDWAIAKNKYMQHVINNQLNLEEDVKKEESDTDDDNEPLLDTSNQELKPEMKNESDDSSKESVKSEEDSDSGSDESHDIDEDDDVEEEENDDNDNQSTTSTQVERTRIKLNDAEDGCTVFVTNIPFIIDDHLLKEFAEKTGPVKYALVCIDKLTEHSKGSGFIKFINKEDADKFLRLPLDQLKLEGQVMQVKPALKRENLQNGKKKEAKDNRNLYLVKEGVIVAGTKAAVGVSASDMSKRLALERSKTQMLKNLNRFVSMYRLVVANLPQHYDDVKFRRLCVKTTGRNVIITEAKVMRDLRAPVGKDGKHPSKGYGFVKFTSHKDALTCLRKLNNNPNVFDKNNRPIVSFSIEDRTALNARKKRLEKSIANNPLANNTNSSESNSGKSRKRKMKMPPDESYVKKGRFKTNQKDFQEVGKFVRKPVDDETGEYTGLTAKEGSQHKMRSNQKLRTQAAVHRQNVKLEKKKSYRTQKLKMAAKERVKQPKQKINKTKNKSKNKRRFKDKSVF